jgi:hypothetical protein
LLHDIGWKLARPDAEHMAASEATSCDAANSIAAKEGILAVCSNTDADVEQQQAQHDVIGATFLRTRGKLASFSPAVLSHECIYQVGQSANDAKF